VGSKSRSSWICVFQWLNFCFLNKNSFRPFFKVIF
jgi:hypothetical protein